MFSKRFTDIIERKGLSRYKISQDTKISEATLSNYCNGKVNPSPSIVKQLSEYLGVPYNYLLTGEGSPDEGSSVSEPGTNYRTRKKNFSKTDVNSVIDYYEKQMNIRDTEINRLLTLIEEKLDVLLRQENNS